MADGAGLQGDAERSLERLHEAAEKDLGAHVQRARNQVEGGFDVESFQNFRKNLIGKVVCMGKGHGRTIFVP